MIPEVLLWSAVVVVSTGILWIGSGWLEASSERLAAYYELPEIVQGAIVVAVGSSFPELSTTVIAALVHGEFELGVAAVVGSALFNILVIPGLSGLAGREQLRSNRDLVYKEAQFYMIAVATLLLAFAFAAIYNPVSDGPAIRGELTRGLAIIPVAVYGLYLFVQYQDTLDYTSDIDVSHIRPGREWALLALALVTIVLGVEGLVRSAVNFGELFGTPSFLWGLTMVAAATSIPDAFVSVRAARHGRGVTSLANVLGSNIFDLLVCIPAGVLVAGATVINFSLAAPLMGVLVAATVALFLLMRTQMVLSRAESVVLLALYAAFIAWMGLETFGFVNLMPGLPPPGAEA